MANKNTITAIKSSLKAFMAGNPHISDTVFSTKVQPGEQILSVDVSFKTDTFKGSFNCAKYFYLSLWVKQKADGFTVGANLSLQSEENALSCPQLYELNSYRITDFNWHQPKKYQRIWSSADDAFAEAVRLIVAADKMNAIPVGKQEWVSLLDEQISHGKIKPQPLFGVMTGADYYKYAVKNARRLAVLDFNSNTDRVQVYCSLIAKQYLTKPLTVKV